MTTPVFEGDVAHPEEAQGGGGVPGGLTQTLTLVTLPPIWVPFCVIPWALAIIATKLEVIINKKIEERRKNPILFKVIIFFISMV